MAQNEATLKVLKGVKSIAEFCEAVLEMQRQSDEWERRYHEQFERANRSEGDLLAARLQIDDLNKTVGSLEAAFSSLGGVVSSVEEILAKHRRATT